MNRPTTISAIVSLFTMLASRWIGSCEPTISIFTRNWPRVSIRGGHFQLIGGSEQAVQRLMTFDNQRFRLILGEILLRRACGDMVGDDLKSYSRLE